VEKQGGPGGGEIRFKKGIWREIKLSPQERGKIRKEALMLLDHQYRGEGGKMKENKQSGKREARELDVRSGLTIFFSNKRSPVKRI